jgi:cysteine desulfurase
MDTDHPIYLDCNATTPVLPEVVEAMLPYLREHAGNPSSSHIFGRRARAAVDGAREPVAALLGCASEEILFTSGGTEASNVAIRGVMELSAKRPASGDLHHRTPRHLRTLQLARATRLARFPPAGWS